jgi:transketolase
MRNTFINTLCELAVTHDDIFIICGDLGYSVLEPFATRFPDRFLNAGVAEQNMTQVAVGLAREGYNVFTYSIGNFPTLRCMEQIRYDVCYHEANVKVVAVGGGYAYGPQGVSHHTTEDIAMLRAIPNMIVSAPADPVEAEAIARFMVARSGPGYVRLNRTGEARVHSAELPLALKSGSFLPVKSGTGTAVLTTGAVLQQVVDEVQQHGLSWAVLSSPFIGDFAVKELVRLAQEFETIITVEEHQLNGGFGSAIVEALSDLYAVGRLSTMPRVKRIGIPNIFIGVAGSQDYLRARAGISLVSVMS